MKINTSQFFENYLRKGFSYQELFFTMIFIMQKYYVYVTLMGGNIHRQLLLHILVYVYIIHILPLWFVVGLIHSADIFQPRIPLPYGNIKDTFIFHT